MHISRGNAAFIASGSRNRIINNVSVADNFGPETEPDQQAQAFQVFEDNNVLSGNVAVAPGHGFVVNFNANETNMKGNRAIGAYGDGFQLNSSGRYIGNATVNAVRHGVALGDVDQATDSTPGLVIDLSDTVVVGSNTPILDNEGTPPAGEGEAGILARIGPVSMHRNTVFGNSKDGIRLENERAHDVRGNRSFANADDDLHDETSGCGTNRWRRNHLGDDERTTSGVTSNDGCIK